MRGLGDDGRPFAWDPARRAALRAELDAGTVVLDLWHADQGFAPTSQRDARVLSVGLVVPPLLFEGVLGSEQRLRDLLSQPSRFSTEAMEGAVLRRPTGERAKALRPGYRRRTDDQWTGPPEHNQLAPTG